MQEIKSMTILDVDEMSISINDKKSIYQVRLPSKWYKDYFMEAKRARLLLAKLDDGSMAVIVIPYK